MQYIKIHKKIFLFSNIKFCLYILTCLYVNAISSLHLFLHEQIKFVLKKILSAVKLLLHYEGRNIL